MNELSEIKIIRKKLNLTQGELAKISNVSQSMIAKVEAGILDPSYTNACKIFKALEDINNKKSVKIKDVLNKNIISVSPHETIKTVITKMKKYEISQTPVIDGKVVVGLISEGILLDAMLSSNDSNIKVSDVMSEAPPMVSLSADFEAASHLLKYYSLVLVSDKGEFVGVLTKADLLRNMLK